MKVEVAVWVALIAMLAVDTCSAAEKSKKKSKKAKKSEPIPDSKMFDSATLKCLVCRSVIDEFRAEILKVDPKKMIDTGTFRINDKGEQARSIVSQLLPFYLIVLEPILRSRFTTPRVD
jgi:hypothetical protein